MSLHSLADAPADKALAESFRVICLCAQWCATCREYRPGFTDLAAQFPDSRFHWLDIEDRADDLGDLDIENFPTLFIARGEAILFFATMPPQLSHLRRMLESFGEQTAEQSRDYARSDPERRGWQENADVGHLLRLSWPEQ